MLVLSQAVALQGAAGRVWVAAGDVPAMVSLCQLGSGKIERLARDDIVRFNDLQSPFNLQGSSLPHSSIIMKIAAPLI